MFINILGTKLSVGKTLYPKETERTLAYTKAMREGKGEANNFINLSKSKTL